MNAHRPHRGSLLRRVAGDAPMLATIAAAVACLVAGFETGAHGSGIWLPAVAVAAQAVLLTARRRHPVTVMIVASALDFLLMAGSGGELGVGALAVMFASYTVADRVPTPRAYPLLGAAAGVSVIVASVTLAPGSLVAGLWLVPLGIARALIAYGVPAAIAVTVGIRRRLVTSLRERAELAEQARERAAADAVRQERAMMARELHDIAAHHLTGIIVSAQAAQALTQSEPAAADRYLTVVEREARTTLDNLRQAVGLLRIDDDAERTPRPSLEDADRLVAAFPGTDIRLRTTSDKSVLGPLAELTGYRMLQESLTNAAQHAPGARCEVEISYRPDQVLITVANTAPRVPPAAPARPDGGGHGLLGMRERAALLGGRLETGPEADGGWRNTLMLPADPPVSEAASAPVPDEEAAR